MYICLCVREREKETEKSMFEVQWGVEDHIPAQLKEPAHASRGANEDERVKEEGDAKEWEG